MQVPRNVEVFGSTEKISNLAKQRREAEARDQWRPAYGQTKRVRARPAPQSTSRLGSHHVSRSQVSKSVKG